MNVPELIENLGIVAIPVIVVIVFVIVQAVKATGIDTKWCPVIAGFSGGILGIVGSMVMSEFPVADPLSAFAYGVVSGLAATGLHQIYKQFSADKQPIGTVAIDTDAETINMDFDVDTLDQLASKKKGVVLVETYEGKHTTE